MRWLYITGLYGSAIVEYPVRLTDIAEEIITRLREAMIEKYGDCAIIDGDIWLDCYGVNTNSAWGLDDTYNPYPSKNGYYDADTALDSAALKAVHKIQQKENPKNLAGVLYSIFEDTYSEIMQINRSVIVIAVFLTISLVFILYHKNRFSFFPLFYFIVGYLSSFLITTEVSVVVQYLVQHLYFPEISCLCGRWQRNSRWKILVKNWQSDPIYFCINSKVFCGTIGVPNHENSPNMQVIKIKIGE